MANAINSKKHHLEEAQSHQGNISPTDGMVVNHGLKRLSEQLKKKKEKKKQNKKATKIAFIVPWILLLNSPVTARFPPWSL